jgi:SAM-dependent methyltransferase
MKPAASLDAVGEASLSPSPKQRVVAGARRFRVLSLLETARFSLSAIKSASANLRYRRENPNFAPPPLWWMHDMYAHVSYADYMETGAATAAAVCRRIDAYVSAENPRVADWGCGLGRVIRHMPSRYALTGFDANPHAIAWCRNALGSASFCRNGPQPPLPAADASFDALYALSVFTHLSALGHERWIAEIERLLAPGGVFLGAFHSTPDNRQLLHAERVRFDAGELVVRDGVKEGGRTFTAFHPETYVRNRLLSRFEVIEGPTPFFGQSLFVARRY